MIDISNKLVHQNIGIMKNLKLLFISVAMCWGYSATGQDSLSIYDYTQKGKYEIGGVDVIGAETRDKNAIRSITGLGVGRTIEIPGTDIPLAIKSLLRLQLFEDVQIIQKKTAGDVVFLEIRLTERNTLSRYSYRGVKKSLHDDLNDIVTGILSKGSIVTNDQKELCKIKIKDYFAGKGNLDAEVKIDEVVDTDKPNAVRLVFDIDKKERVKVEGIYFLGIDEVSGRKLRKSMKNTKQKGTLFKKTKYVEADYEMDKESIINYYNKNGFRDAKIVKDSLWRNALGDLMVMITIDEGERYYFRDIGWKGNSKYTSDQLTRVLGIVEGDVFNPELLENRLRFSQDGRDISSLYLDDGYLFFEVNPVETAVINDSIDLEMRIYEGPQATIANVTIEGNDRTNEHVIRRELRTRPGEKFSRSQIIRSQREIINLGYFNPENLGIETPVNPQRGTVDINYKVEERPSDQLELSAGYGGASGLLGTLGVTFNNFSVANIKKRETWSPLPQGDGQKLSVRLQSNSRFFRSGNLSFTEPWLGGKKRQSFTVGGLFSAFDYSDFAAGSLNIYRVYAGLGSQLKWPDDFFSRNTTATFEFLNMDNYAQGRFFVDLPGGNAINITDGNFKNFSIKQVFTRSSVSEPIYPRRGSRISLTMQFTPPYSLFRSDDFWECDAGCVAGIRADLIRTGGPRFTVTSEALADAVNRKELATKHEWLEYHKWRVDAEWYYNVVNKLVIAASAKIGILGSYNNDIGYSPFERFELGGDGLSNQSVGITGKDILALRGYETTDIEQNNTGGATVFNKYTVELRYPLSLNPNSSIYFHTFFQGGNSWGDFREFNPFELKRSAGFGMRVFLPMFGLLGFDYGLGLDKNLPTGTALGNYGKFSIVLGFEPD